MTRNGRNDIPDDDDYLDSFIELFEKEDENKYKYNENALNIY